MTPRPTMRAGALALISTLVMQPALASEATSPDRPDTIAVGLAVDQPKSHGFCPRLLGVKAAIEIGEGRPETMLRYRFLEDGSPVSQWKTVSATSGDTLHLRHSIQVTEGTGPVRTSQSAFSDRGSVALGAPGGVREKSTVGIEVWDGDVHASDVALYQATCAEAGYAALQPAPGVDLPDLTATGGIRLGGTFVPWSGNLTLGPGDIVAAGPLGCTVRYTLDVANTGPAPAPTHSSRLQRGARTLAVLQTPPLKAERTRTLRGQILLPSGQSTLRLRIDQTRLVQEISEANNSFAVRVTAPARCGAGPIPGRP